MKTLVAVCSYKNYRDGPYQKAVRETWMGKWSHLTPCRFLLGVGNENPEGDEWIFPVDDTYHGCARKLRAACLRAHAEDYDYLFYTMLDVYVIVPRLLETTLGDHQYFGPNTHSDEGVTYVSGTGAWFGREAMDAIGRSPPMNYSYDDLYAGVILHAARIYAATHGGPIYSDSHFRAKWDWSKRWQAIHLGCGTGSFVPEWMYECHQRFLEQGHD